MRTGYSQLAGLLAFSIFGFGQVAAADDTKPAKPPVYIIVGDITGEIVKVSATSITLRVPKPPPPPVTASPQNKQQYQQQMQAQQKFAKNAADPNQNHTDYTFDFAVDAQARIKNLPPKLDSEGKKVAYTAEEKQKLKGNTQLPGWKADISELKVGETVDAHIVKLQGSNPTLTKTTDKPADKKEDFIVRWALIVNDPPKK